VNIGRLIGREEWCPDAIALSRYVRDRIHDWDFFRDGNNELALIAFPFSGDPTEFLGLWTPERFAGENQYEILALAIVHPEIAAPSRDREQTNFIRSFDSATEAINALGRKEASP